MGWIIFAAVVLAVFLLLCCTVNVRFEYGEGIRLRISFWWFTIFAVPSAKKKKKRTGKKKPQNKSLRKSAETKSDTAATTLQPPKSGGFSEEKSDEITPSDDNSSEKKTEGKTDDKDDEAKKSKRSLGEIFEIVKLLVDGFGKPLKKLLKRSRIYHFRLNIICGGDDAAKAALNFGRTNILVGNALGWIDMFFTLKPADDIHIDVDFIRPETKAECSFTLKVTLLAALAFLFTGAGRSVRYYLTHPEAAQALKSK